MVDVLFALLGNFFFVFLSKIWQLGFIVITGSSTSYCKSLQIKKKISEWVRVAACVCVLREFFTRVFDLNFDLRLTDTTGLYTFFFEIVFLEVWTEKFKGN